VASSHEHILGAGRRSLIVAQNDRGVGLLTLHDVKEIPRSDWPTTTAAQAIIPAERMKRIRPDAELGDALGEMDRDGANRLPVMVGDRIQGVLGRDDVISLLRATAEFSRQQNKIMEMRYALCTPMVNTTTLFCKASPTGR
jgi:CBS domain-containing protein